VKRSGFRNLYVAVAAIVLLPLLYHVARHRSLPNFATDEAFVAFRCGGAAVLQRANPYLVEPMRGCEARARVIPAGVVEPAPLPPVTLGFFAIFATLPYRAAALLWAVILLASYAIASLGLVRLAPRVPPLAVWLALAPSLVFLSGYYGETPPLAAAALVLAGLALRAERPAAAACAVTVATAFEPHVAGAAWLALGIGVPRARLPLALGLAIASGLSLLAVGPSTAVSYLTAVLPAHAASELPANDQYSLTSLLFAAGWPAGAALTAGLASYALMLGLGCVLAPGLARRATAPELMVFLPAAAVLLGGTFVHDLQMSLALPLVVIGVEAATAPGTPRFRTWLAYATMLVGAIPAPTTALPGLAVGAAAACAVAFGAVQTAGRRPARALVAGMLVAAPYAAFAALVHEIGRVPATILRAFPAAAANALAEPTWQAYVAAVSHPATPGEFITKLTVEALLIATLGLAATARRAPAATVPKPLL
jgi:hypothetical protein